MTDKKNDIVEEHFNIEEFEALHFFPSHEHRYESAEFRHTKARFHQEHAKCWVDNGFCSGNVEIHHNYIEWAMSNATDWDKFHQDHPDVKDVDSYEQMLPLCTKHHRSPFFGKHMIDDPTWEWQKYGKYEDLVKFEKHAHEAMEELKKKHIEKKKKEKEASAE